MNTQQLIAELQKGNPNSSVVLVSEENIFTIIEVNTNIDGTTIIAIEPILDVGDYANNLRNNLIIGGGGSGGATGSGDALDVFGDLEKVNFGGI